MNALAIFLGMIGPWQIALIVVIVLLLFGGRKIPELMRGLGSGIKEFKDASKEDDTPAHKDEKIEEPKKS
ncbi:MAG: twin-arginine translocase TatA/TatE family subunit [Cytophagaceae bacterium]|nr:twin-arginine translocase TatA/TatE family subunit [Cytophagaceae bacterium]|tara:strand:+ start:61451 stop:61660 length:210 start_codon:yes stop_codon:yes gene_type:complete